jgi:hypothetical protein
MLSCQVHGCVTILRRLVGTSYDSVDIRAELFDQDSKHVDLAQLGCSAQGYGGCNPNTLPRPTSQLGDVASDAALNDGVV